MKKYFSIIMLAVIATNVFAQGRFAVYHEISKNPSILLEPGFWISAVVILVLIGIYHAVKDKE